MIAGKPFFEAGNRMLATGDAELDAKLVAWMGRKPHRTIEQAEVIFRGEDRFVCTLGDGLGAAYIASRAMGESWPDCVRNALGVTLACEQHGIDSSWAGLGLTLEQWLEWQENTRV